MNNVERQTTTLARNVRRHGHLDLPGAGQVAVVGPPPFLGRHPPNPDPPRPSIVDVSDPKRPRMVATITPDDPGSHSHKARVGGDILIVNHERNMSRIGRRAEQLPAARRALADELKREPTPKEIAARMSVTEDDLRMLEEFEQRGYHNGGFKIYDVSEAAQPKLIHYQKTGGIGVHRFDMDERYAYISTEMAGYVGNILVIYDLRDPRKPRRSRAGGCRASTSPAGRRRPGRAAGTGCITRCASARDVGELLARRLLRGRRLRHAQAEEPSALQLPSAVSRADPYGDAGAGRLGGRRIALAIDEEDQAQSASEEEAGAGARTPASVTFDVTDLGAIKPLAQFQVSEADCR